MEDALVRPGETVGGKQEGMGVDAREIQILIEFNITLVKDWKEGVAAKRI